MYCEKYRLLGKIDIYDGKKKILRERKRQIKQVYDGYIFQLYGQYFSLIEMGYEVDKKKIIIDGTISSLGFHEVMIELHKKVIAKVRVEITKEK